MNGEALSNVVSRVLGGAYVDVGGGPEDTIFVAGSGRGGTTWLADAINHQREYRLVFEPFRPDKVPEVSGFRRRQYLRIDEPGEEYLGPARRILCGGVRNRWVDRFHRTFVARRRIVKDVRANLMLGWMAEAFPEMPVVLVLRHPCAVVESQMSLGWRDILDETLEQEALVEDHLRPVVERMRATRDPFDRRVLLWCVENVVPLRQLPPHRRHVVFYEELLTDPETTLRRLFTSLGLDFDDTVVRRMKTLSPVSRKGVGVAGRGLDGWQSVVPEDRRKRTARTLSLFGLDGVYGEGLMPPDPDGVRVEAWEGA